MLGLLPRLVAAGGEVWLADPGRAPVEEFLTRIEDGWERRSDTDGAVTVHRLRRTA